MIISDNTCLSLYAFWVCGLQKDKDPDFSAKLRIIRDVMDVLGVEGAEKFEGIVEDYWVRHFQAKTPFDWNM